MKSHYRAGLIALLAVALFTTIAWAAVRAHDTTTAVSLVAADVRAATYTSNDYDVRQYLGQGKVVLDAEAQGSGITNTCKVQESALATGATSTATSGDADLDLNLATAGTPTVAAKFTQSGTRQIKYLDLRLKKHGTINNAKIVTAYLYSSATTTPNAILATSVTVSANSVSDTNYQTVRFTLTTPYQLTDATNYWVAIDSDYAASDTNYLSWHVETVGSGGTAATSNGSAWTAVTTQNPVFKLQQYNFTDTVTFTAVGNAASFQSSGIELDSIGGYLRAVCTVAGGSSTGAYSMVLIAPKQN